jgi:hypothetical protein
MQGIIRIVDALPFDYVDWNTIVSYLNLTGYPGDVWFHPSRLQWTTLAATIRYLAD